MWDNALLWSIYTDLHRSERLPYLCADLRRCAQICADLPKPVHFFPDLRRSAQIGADLNMFAQT